MSLNDEERTALVSYRLQKAKDTMSETKDIIAASAWYAAANRLYYACYYAVSALLIANGHTAHTHSGVIGMFGLHFVKTKLVSDADNILYQHLFELRQSGDYSDWVTIDEDTITPLVEPAEKFIEMIERLIIT